MAVISSKVLQYCLSPENKYHNSRILFIILLGAVIYGNTFSVPFNFDDTANLQDNPAIRNLSIDWIRAAFPARRLFGIFTFQLNYFFSDWNVFWYHFTNLAIHIATALTVYHFLILLFKTPYVTNTSSNHSSNILLPFFVAVLFTTHPVQTQAVTYIVQRFASLAAFLYLAALVSYLKMRLCQVEGNHFLSFASVKWSVAFFLLVLLAVQTKEIAYTLPAAVILVELLFFGFNWEKFSKITSVAMVLSGACLLGYLSCGRSIDTLVASLDETTRVQTITSRSDYLFTQFRVIMTYIRLIVCPINQSIDYDYVLSHSLFEWRVILSLLGILLLFSAAVWMLWKSRSTQPLLRFASFGIFWFFLTLSVESSFLPIIDLIFEHRVYLPSVGAITAIVASMLFLWQEDSARQKLCLAFIAVAMGFGIATWNRNSVWRSEASLWEDATSKYPNSARGWNNLGGAHIKEKNPLNALKALTRSIELDPSKADAWNNLGIAIDMIGVYNDRFHRTAEMFREPSAVEGKTVNKWLGEVNNNLGLAYEILGNLPKAVENYRNAIGYNPALSLAYYNLGIVSAKMGNIAQYSEQQQILWLLDPVLADRLKLRTGMR